MKESTLQKEFIEKGCFPHQAEFAAAFFASDAARKQLLISGPGMGKGFASVAIINHALSSGLARRVLVLAPSPLLVQWQEMIRRGDSATSAMIVDRRRLRELEDSQPVGGEVWPENGIVILSLDLAKQADVAAGLVRCTWDLVVVDEVQRATPQTQRAKVLLDLMTLCPKMRMLLLQVGGLWTTAETNISAELFREAAVTVWTRETLRNHQGEPLLPEVQMKWITYLRQPEEKRLLARLQESLRSLDTTNAHMRLAATLLLQSASSSPFALEQRLRRIRQRRNELVHGTGNDQKSESEAEELGFTDPDEGDTGDVLRSFVELARIADPILKELEELPADSKCDALLQLLDDVGTTRSPDRRVCVFTRFADTATYLENALREVHPIVRVVTGSRPLTDREQDIAEFAQKGGILIATESIETTIPELAAAIFYDIPLNPAVLEARMGQFVRVGRRGPIQIFGFMDESNSLVIERLQRKIAEVKEAISEAEIQKVLFSKDGGN